MDAADSAATALRFSFGLITTTGLDIVDLQLRIQGESARLASALRSLGETAESNQAANARFGPNLVALDEAAQQVAARGRG